MTGNSNLIDIKLPRMHGEQRKIDASIADVKVVRAGRRGGKTTYGARKSIKKMFAGKRVLLASPSMNQVDAFWDKLMQWYHPAIERGVVIRNKTKRLLTFADPHNPGRIDCRTARFADDLRGGFGDQIILDEAWMLDESAIDEVILPMLFDNGGELDIYSTPKAGTWFNKLCEDIMNGLKPGHELFHFTSRENPYINQAKVEASREQMSERAWREEVLAELLDEVKGALWSRKHITRQQIVQDDLQRIVVAIDPAASANAKSDETGIVVAARKRDGQYIVLEDLSGRYSPNEWATVAINAYHKWRADRIIAEKNNGGDMVSHTIATVNARMPVHLVWASKGKFARAEPIAALYEQGKVSHGNIFPELENQMVTWTIEASFSPDRMDALVWAMTELSESVKGRGGVGF